MRALLSVYDKTGIEPLAQSLVEAGYEIISSGGTFQRLKNAGIAVQEVSAVTGSPEMLGGRVKTLHPAVHAGILARRDQPDDMAQLREADITPIDLVVVNLYPFQAGLDRQLNEAEQVELIDIGGPTMLRSAAKNFAAVTVLSDPSQYTEFIERLHKNQIDLAYRKALAAQVFATMRSYDAAVARYLGDADELDLHFAKQQTLRYGENPQQTASLYKDLNHPGFLSDFELLGGKALSYSNLADIDAAFGVVQDFEEICVCAVKHNTPCGVAVGGSVAEAYAKAYAGDPVSIFGGIVACNQAIDAATAEQMNEIFLEVVVAPDFTPEALEIFAKKPNLRIVKVQNIRYTAPLMRSVSGGLLVQDSDAEFSNEFDCVTKRQPTEQEFEDLQFGMKVSKHVKSNAIVIVKDGQTLGIGGGQTNRIDAARLALRTAKPGAVLASDGFFPFDDVVRAAHEAGIQAIIQPGGSIKDQLSIEACDELGIAMLFSGRRHFKH